MNIAPLTLKREGPVLTCTLNRPEKRNALNRELVEALRRALKEEAREEAVRAVVLTGAGKAFSAGADLAALKALQEATPEENLEDSEYLAGLFRDIYLHPKPIIAKVNGHAIAGGCGLAAVCDFSLVSSRARLGFTEVQIGFVPAIVMTFVLRKVGEACARDLFLRGQLIGAEEAAAMGLVTRALSPEELDEAAHALADEIAGQTSGSAVALTKRLMARMPGMGLDEALSAAAEMNAFARGTADCQAGIAAFLANEDPPWRSGG